MDGYHTNQDGQWKTSDQWRAEEANTSNKKPKKSGRGKYAAKLVASAVAFGLIAGLVMQGVTYGFSKAQESLRQQARVGSVRHRAANQKVLVLGLSLGKKMVRS